MNKIVISTNENSTSEIIIKNDLAYRLDNFFENKKYFLITNNKIAKLYPQIIYKFNSNRVIIIKDGEKYKNFETYNFIVQKLLEQKIERKDAIVALGGGVVGDLAGFVASTILRGVELIQVPTTLLAMCDSSIGGKTGFNTKFGKNLIGTFYSASKVLIDPMFVKTLNKHNYNCGMGEIVKYAFIEKSCLCEKETNLFDFLVKNQTKDIEYELEHVITACAFLKASVVQKDKREGGLRKILNFGHTYAHAFEKIGKYKKFSHGEAVAYGIKYASKLALNLRYIDRDYYDKIVYLIDKFQLTKKNVKFKPELVVSLMFQDKKVQDGKINLILPTKFAEVELFDNIDLISLKESLL